MNSKSAGMTFVSIPDSGGNHMIKSLHTFQVALASCSLILLVSGCAPTVRLDTPEPVKIDVAMKVDVYTHQQESSGQAGAGKEKKTPRERRRHRMAEVQNLKNDRIVGEGNDGYLEMHTVPTDPTYADYAQRILAEENDDRKKIFDQQAEEKDKPVRQVAREFAQRAIEASFPGEWIQKPDGEWVRK